MSEVRGVPAGRYGSADAAGRDARDDRRLKVTGGVLGVLMLTVVGWFGADYIAGQSVSGEMIKWKVASARTVEVHLEVRKDADAQGVCTLRARAEDGAEVGRKDVRIARGTERSDTVETVRTTRRATAAELMGCTPA